MISSADVDDDEKHTKLMSWKLIRGSDGGCIKKLPVAPALAARKSRDENEAASLFVEIIRVQVQWNSALPERLWSINWPPVTRTTHTHTEVTI